MNIVHDAKYRKFIPFKHVDEIVSKMLTLFKEHKSSSFLTDENIDSMICVSKSEYFQDQYCQLKYETYIKPQIIDLKRTVVDENGETTTSTVCKSSYLNLKLLTCKYLSNGSILKKILKERISQKKQQSTIFKEITDGKSFQRLLGQFKLELGIDDAELSPSNGFSNQKHLFLYGACADIPFEERVRSNDIELILCVNRKKMMTGYMNNRDEALRAFFFKFKSDLEELHNNGINIRIGSEKVNVKVNIASISGDNLGIYELLGFKMSFHPNSFGCRFCPETKVNREFQFQSFDLDVTNCAPPDVLQDLPEGVLSDVVEFLLSSIAMKTFLHPDEIVKIYKKFNNEMYEGRAELTYDGSLKTKICFD